MLKTQKTQKMQKRKQIEFGLCYSTCQMLQSVYQKQNGGKIIE